MWPSLPCTSVNFASMSAAVAAGSVMSTAGALGCPSGMITAGFALSAIGVGTAGGGVWGIKLSLDYSAAVCILSLASDNGHYVN